ncbi:hypothetical protein GCM10011583_55870 [Streptomyces camponoticapitis]|uniref:Uncharacterized protein n=1 Tax=Streptomyces camponoticapitis TaxID=1616125 RepID=A0ABQ2EMZ3_9ACTN|nr:hypothetical protein [Streptomyces camponoticapitis]GGK16764.1 hypothetical protein GCM10011583_55870 [Streptomyces camponoticapitis]
MSLDPDVRIQEDRALTTDLVTGRMPRGADLPTLAEEHRVRARSTDDTGTETVK